MSVSGRCENGLRLAFAGVDPGVNRRDGLSPPVPLRRGEVESPSPRWRSERAVSGTTRRRVLVAPWLKGRSRSRGGRVAPRPLRQLRRRRHRRARLPRLRPAGCRHRPVHARAHGVAARLSAKTASTGSIPDCSSEDRATGFRRRRGASTGRAWSSRISHRQRFRHGRWPTGGCPAPRSRCRVPISSSSPRASIASRVGSSRVLSWRLAPAAAHPSGMPRPSQASDHFQPDLALSQGLGPVPGPPEGASCSGVHRHVGRVPGR